MKTTPNPYQTVCHAAHHLTTACILMGSIASAGTIIYEPDDYSSSYPLGLWPGAITTTRFSGVTLNHYKGGVANDTKISSYSGNRYYSPSYGGNFLYNATSEWNDIFRITYANTTNMTSLRVWGGKLTPGGGVLNAYSATGTLISTTSITGTIGDGDTAQTLTVTGEGIKYAELVPTVGGGLRADYLMFSGTPSYTVGQEFIGYQDTGPGGVTTAALIGGQATASRTVTSTFTLGSEVTGGAATIAGDVFNIDGTGTDTWVLQMSYTDQLLSDLALSELEVRMLWQDETGEFINAVMGNSNAATLGDSLFVVGAYDGAVHTLGSHGVDTENNTVWAVLDHNSSFAVGVIPEPSPWFVLLSGIGGVAFVRRRRAGK